jgi:molecular chaperone GrpE
MSKKEKSTQDEPLKDSSQKIDDIPGEELIPEQIAEPAPTLEDLKNKLDEVEKQANEFKEGWQRSLADFQNYRRRVEAEKTDSYQIAVGNIIKKYLPIVDDMERALATRPAELAWVDGIDLIYRKLQTILESEGLKCIDAEGKQFDPVFHEAISEEPCEDQPSGVVFAVIQNGYMLGDRVIRPALVRVAK